MSVLLFIAILVVLIIVHELGHFIIAKRAGIRVDEFGLGYPPRVWGKKVGETVYSLNLLPFGGFVRIFGEDPDEDSLTGPERSRSFVHKPKAVQAFALAGGIIFNIIFAWALISVGYMTGLPSSVDGAPGSVADPKLVITSVLPGSPSFLAGLRPGDAIASVTSESGADLGDISAAGVSSFIKEHGEGDITVVHVRGNETLTTTVTPVSGLVEGQKAIGITMDLVGTLKLPPHKALWEGAKTTWGITVAIVLGLWQLISGVFQGDSNLSEVTGPVGIAGMVGDATSLGFAYILTFTAFISLNLAIINLVPFPALDGGRILFVAIEAVRRKPLPANFTNTANAIGFVLLLALMAAVTFNDIVRLF